MENIQNFILHLGPLNQTGFELNHDLTKEFKFTPLQIEHLTRYFDSKLIEDIVTVVKCEDDNERLSLDKIDQYSRLGNRFLPELSADQSWISMYDRWVYGIGGNKFDGPDDRKQYISCLLFKQELADIQLLKSEIDGIGCDIDITAVDRLVSHFVYGGSIYFRIMYAIPNGLKPHLAKIPVTYFN